MLRSKPIAGLLVLTSASLLLGVDPAPTKNLVFNGDFETAAKDKPAGWHTQAAAPEYVTGEPAKDVHGGKHAVKLSDPKGFHERWAVNNEKRVEVIGGAKYKFSAWVKASETWTTEYVQLRAEQFDGKGELIRAGENPFLNGPKERPTGGEWKQITQEFTTAADAKSIRPLLALSSGGAEGSKASATFDDVTIEKMD